MTIEEDKKFLETQREPCRPGHMSGVDLSLTQREERSEKRARKEEERAEKERQRAEKDASSKFSGKCIVKSKQKTCNLRIEKHDITRCTEKRKYTIFN